MNTKKIAKVAVVAALYAVLTLALGAISYGPIQFRISEVMTLLPLFGGEYIIGLTIGCFLANVIGPYGVPDMIFGTLATFISVYLVYLTGKKLKKANFKIFIASLWPTIINGIIIGAMLNIFFDLPLLLSMAQVALGEFVVITIIGAPLFKIISKKYSKIFTSENI